MSQIRYSTQPANLGGRCEHWTDQFIANELGVGRKWVSQIRVQLAQDGKLGVTSYFPTSMQRDIARNLLDSDNEFTQADIAEESGLSRKTVGKIARGEDTGGDSETETGADSETETSQRVPSAGGRCTSSIKKFH